MSSMEFTTQLEAAGPGGAWPFMRLPADAVSVFGTRARIAVKGTLNGFPYQTSILPSGDGSFHMMVNKEMRHGAGIEVGSEVAVVMEADTSPREIEAPDDLRVALENNPTAADIFGKLAYSHRKEYVRWIQEAKKPETRATRIEKTVEMIVSGKKALR